MIPRPVTSSLPVTIDPVVLADKGAQLSGRLIIRSMARLRAMLADDDAEAEVNLVFDTTEGSRLRRMYGHIVADVRCVCQRCLEPMALTLKADPNTIVQRQGEAPNAVPSEADVQTFGSVPVALAELVEEELLLVMPMVPMHAIEECPARHYVASAKSKGAAAHPPEKLANRSKSEKVRK